MTVCFWSFLSPLRVLRRPAGVRLLRPDRGAVGSVLAPPDSGSEGDENPPHVFRGDEDQLISVDQLMCVSFQGHSDWVTDVSLSADRKLVVSSSKVDFPFLKDKLDS